MGQRALSRTVGPHDGVHFPGVDVQVNAAKYFLVADLRVQVFNIQHRNSFQTISIDHTAFCSGTFSKRPLSPWRSAICATVTPAKKLASTIWASSHIDFCEHTAQ